MDSDAITRAVERLAQAADGRPDPGELEAALERARTQIEALAATTAELETTLPDRVGNAVREGVRAEALPLARQTAELRGLTNTVLRRLERVEGGLLGDRHARVDDLALIVELVTSGWKSVDARLERLEQGLQKTGGGAVVYSLGERQAS
jgi:hypothetical protein